jgi:hypothetical protein
MAAALACRRAARLTSSAHGRRLAELAQLHVCPAGLHAQRLPERSTIAVSAGIDELGRLLVADRSKA